jgi:hypothetical protein
VRELEERLEDARWRREFSTIDAIMVQLTSYPGARAGEKVAVGWARPREHRSCVLGALRPCDQEQ